MPLTTEVKAGEIITINGCPLRPDRKVKLTVLDQAEIVYPMKNAVTEEKT